MDEICHMIENFYKSLDINCISFDDGQEVVSAYEKGQRFDAIFLDIEMKQLDGMKTAEKIRSISSDVPIVFLTSHTELAYFNLSENVSDVNPIAIIPVSLTFLFIVVAVILSVKSSQTRYYSKINQLSEAFIVAQAKHFEKVRESDAEMRRLRHDMKNHVLCMNELYRLEKYKELGEYLKQLCNTITKIQAPVTTGNEIVDAIISEKAEEAKQHKVKLQVEGDFKELNISAMDLCTILSNLLDNAIEALKILQEPEKEVFVSARKTGNFFFLSVKNITAFYVNISDGMKTTKGNKKEHGLGIGNVERTVKKCGGEFRLDCSKEGEKYVFTAEVMVPLNLRKI